ncbi:serine/threonine-protein kinase, partial [Streptomyces sp. NPDC059762]|uniref:serine/threonine-protein kinase n=1 Tax=Streptomyces sp. NPDC059762 TaxID=3346938 RepID=UPI00365C4852
LHPPPPVRPPARGGASPPQDLSDAPGRPGGSLAHVIGDYGPLPPRYVCTLLDQLLSGLATVHAEGVVHRDIKPANILMEATGTGRPHLRLSDFGISMRKGEPRLTETNFVVGTPGYFAPEQLLGVEPDFTADLYAVGLVALYLLHGTRPDSQALMEHFLTHGTPPAPATVPEPLWQVLAGLLQPDPQARFRTATGARKALNAAAEMLPEPEGGEEPVEIFDQLGPLPAGFGPEGPVARPVQDTPPAPPVQDAPPAPPVPAAAPPAPAPLTYGQPYQEQYQPVPGPSETGSFHLPPPVTRPAPLPATHPYTAAPVQAPTQPQALPGRRPGPPPKVAVPVLLLALVSLAVGFWALTRI